MKALGAGQTNVSRHLSLMHQAGVVSRRKERNDVFYQVNDPTFAEVCRTVCKQIASQIDDRAPLRDELIEFASNHRAIARTPSRCSGCGRPG